VASSLPLVYRQFVRDSRRWNGFEFRPGDIVISTPTKCGTTWTQMICALLIFQSPTFDRPLDRISPWLDMLTRPLDEVVGNLRAQTHRRFIKTHTPLDGLPYDERVTYICVGRDPRDVALSWDNHQSNQDRGAMLRARSLVLGDRDAPPASPDPAGRPKSPYDRFWAWVDDPTPPERAACTLRLTMHHLQTFWAVRDRPNIVMLHYSDLIADLDGQMRHLAERLGIAVDEERWASLVAAASLSQMREHADDLAPNATESIWRDNQSFFRQATMGQWRDLLDRDDLRRYQRRVEVLTVADCTAWAHHDPSWAAGL
jgi:aryl sulfotransferase